MNEETLSSDYLYRGRILTLRVDEVELSNGVTSTREVIEHKPAVVVLPFEAPDRVYLIRQFRKPIEQILLEAPAGIMDDGEDPLVAAKRELQEETGFTATEWTSVGGSYTAPGFCDEYLHFYIASGLEKGGVNLDHDEQIEVVSYTLSEMDELIRTNQIVDGKTAQIYLMFKFFFGEVGGVN